MHVITADIHFVDKNSKMFKTDLYIFFSIVERVGSGSPELK